MQSLQLNDKITVENNFNWHHMNQQCTISYNKHKEKIN